MEIILPVYNGLQDLKRCVNSLLVAKNVVSWHAYIINDASPDQEVKRYLETLEDKRFTVLHNANNLGFVKSVNKGFSITEHDVVLLNSDTIVYDYWLDRLIAHGHADERVATVTPLSNNATIASFPEFNSEDNTTAGFLAEDINAVCQFVNNGLSVPVPTGIGFCMFVSRKALNAVGLFDEENFGRGYGEENDFCQRAAEQGFINLIACDTYVYHAGGVSFGEEKQARVLAALQKLSEMHPQYEQRVHEFISLDPLREYRLRVLFELSRQSKNSSLLHICHNYGGGTLQHIRELGALSEERWIHWILRVVGGNIVRLEWATAPSSFVDIDSENDLAFLWNVLKYLGVAKLHVHHISGMPREVLAFASGSGLEYDVTLHDYYFIGANPTLTDREGSYKEIDGIPETITYLSPSELASWQETQAAFLENAERVICPSEATRRIYQRYYSTLNYVVAPHADSEKDFPYPDVSVEPIDGNVKILVLGALSREKGADVLEAVSKKLSDSVNLEFVLLGYAYRQLHGSIRVLGGYKDRDADDLLRREAPHIIWLPALWPETYSYTLSIALRSGRPILAPNLGAFPERLAKRPLTRTYSPSLGVPATMSTLLAFVKEVSEVQVRTPYSWKQAFRRSTFYQFDYLENEPRAVESSMDYQKLFEDLSLRLQTKLNIKERLLSFLLGLKRYTLFRTMLKRLPVKQKIRVVKFFTKRNLLDIEKHPVSH